jgi:hypothetical protein
MVILAAIMNLFRISVPRVAFILFTGLAFLNMGFVLLEVNLLNMNKDLPVFCNLSNFGAEEEEQGEESSSGESGKEVDLHVGDMLAHHKVDTSNNEAREKHLHNQKLISGFLTKFSPPPELA